MANVFSIVEGHGEVKAVPILLRRLDAELVGLPAMNCFVPYRLPRNKLLKEDELRRALAFAQSKLRSTVGKKLILILMDADDDCPVDMKNVLTSQHGNAVRQTPASIVFAVREYESWFIAANMDEQVHRDLPADAPVHPEPETIANAKGVFERDYMKAGRTYSETVDQPRFTACFNVDTARRSSSFEKLLRDLTTALS